MSWYVEFLLSNKDRIRATEDIELDEFNDLIVLESKIKQMLDDGKITWEEYHMVDLVITYPSLYKLEKATGIPRKVASREFIRTCNKISDEMGSYFTDEGYISYMQDKYRLTESQVETLKRFITSEYRHKMLRKIFGDKE